MNLTYDTIIVGGGLAGACAALHLSRHERVLLLEAGDPAAGASGAAAGLVNPLTGLRARPVWRVDDALSALHEALALAGAVPLFRGTGILRPAGDADQVDRFREAAQAYPHYARWLTTDEARLCHPGTMAPRGAMLVTAGGAMDVPAFVHTLLDAARHHGATVRTGARVTGWDEDNAAARVRVEAGEEAIAAGRVLLAPGYGYRHFPELARLHLHPVKGQTVRVALPARPPAGALPHLAGHGYVVHEDEALVVGSTYEHDFTDVRPSPEASRLLIEKAAAMLPALRDATVLEAQAGVRVNVPGTRLPMVGPLPGRRRLWVFTGLGSKGLLMAPLLASRLSGFFEDPASIPKEIRVRVRV